jgi:membrane protease YdiL (CAAX protease family)
MVVTKVKPSACALLSGPTMRSSSLSTQLWLRIPALLRAVLAGILVGGVGTLAWAKLADENIRHGSHVPWAVPIMAVLLLAWWRYFVRGRGWPASTAEARRQSARANRVPDELWGPAIGAGLLGLMGVLLLQGVLGRLVSLPQQQDLDPSKYPLGTVIAWVVMGAIVAGVVEETALRGYTQGGIERRHGLVPALLVTGSLFGFAHFSHPEVGIALLPFYLAVSAVYGGLAYATNSTLPSMILHTGGNIFSAFSLFTEGRSEWQLGTGKPALVWESGVDAAFAVNLILLLAVSAGTWLAYKALISAGRATRLTPG